MSNYVITTDFRPKDSLPPGNPSKVIKGADFATEFEAIRDSIQTKADIASPTFTGVPAGPTPTDGDNTTQLATTAFVRRLLMAGSDIASASTITPPAYGNSFTVTGTTTITAIGSGGSWDGRLVLLRFAGALTLTNSANLNLGGANITTTAGDFALFRQRTSGTWDLVSYRRSNGALFGDGSALTNLNASNLSSGTVPSARLNTAYTDIRSSALGNNAGDSSLVLDAGAPEGPNSTRMQLVNTRITAGSDHTGTEIRWRRVVDSTIMGFIGFSTISSRAVVLGYQGADFLLLNSNGALTVNAPAAGSHTINGNVTLGGVLTGNGSGLTSLNASNLASGIVPTARLGAGTANNAVFLRGDGTWTNVVENAFEAGGYVFSRHASVTGFAWHVTSAGTNEKRALFLGTPGQLQLSLYDDAFSSSLPVFTIPRSGNTPTDFYLSVRARTVPVSVAFSATPTFNARNSNVFYFGTLTGNVTSMTISNAVDGQTIQIRFVQDGTGGRTVALPSGAVVSGSINTAANAVTWLVLTYVASASRWEGTWTRIS